MFEIRVAEPDITEDDIAAVVNALREGRLSSGKIVEGFERNFASYVNVKEAIAVNSGTAALHLALESLGIKNGSEVITTSFTFAATSNVIVLQNCKPIFTDIDPNTYNLDPSKIEKSITSKTKAIMPIHYAGQCSDMDEIKEIAEKHDLVIIEDAAPALGGTYKKQKAGSLSEIAGFSFFPDKNITTGEGGMITTNNSKLAEKCRILRKNGATKRYYNEYIGWNFKMPDINAALGNSQLKRIENIVEQKNEKAKNYNDLFKDVENVKTPFVKDYNRSTFMLYSILFETTKLREKVRLFLESKGIETRINFPPMHLQPIYQKLFGFQKGMLKNTEEISEKILGLPIYINMSSKQQEDVVIRIKEAIVN